METYLIFFVVGRISFAVTSVHSPLLFDFPLLILFPLSENTRIQSKNKSTSKLFNQNKLKRKHTRLCDYIFTVCSLFLFLKGREESRRRKWYGEFFWMNYLLRRELWPRKLRYFNELIMKSFSHKEELFRRKQDAFRAYVLLAKIW